MENKNTGILLTQPTATDYIFGGVKFIPASRNVKDWSASLPLGELQKTTSSDMMDCVTFSGAHPVETQVNQDITDGKYRQEALDYFQSAGYMQNGKFRASVRYNAVLNGTTFQGQYMNIAGDGFRHDGLLPDIDMPMTPNMTWAEYYTQPTAEQMAKAKKIYDYMSISYQWVPPTLEMIKAALPNAPVQIGITVCPVWSADNPIHACTGICQHCVMVYAVDNSIKILDHYTPFLKELTPDYHIFAAMQYIVEPALPPTLWAKLLALVIGKKI